MHPIILGKACCRQEAHDSKYTIFSFEFKETYRRIIEQARCFMDMLSDYNMKSLTVSLDNLGFCHCIEIPCYYIAFEDL
uniref:Uncharacterized protein n=2 Tax=Lepeophtheirus salmonis TaxID=72036 RepID=A0A0K2V4L1_LEPSM